ncbi:hypothetical protein B0H13DRAFT_2655962 [Mycena leptocephala]|nr:hypothetical protein B0H13DRAFT_2655962 [Mycena leptocephala]
MSTFNGSPIFLLPPEITATIFGHCFPSPSDSPLAQGLGRVHEETFSDVPRPSPHAAPLLLTQICRQWREICLDTPDLWASIAFDDTGSIELLKTWLSRARNHPLTVSLEFSNKTRVEQLMEAVKPYCAQWQDVHFHLPMSAHLQLNMSAFPRLKRLALIGPMRRQPCMMVPLVFRDAPLLRDVELSNLLWNVQVDLPFEQLTTFHFNTFLNATQIIAILRRCSNLLHLSCGSDVSPVSVELHSLRTLEIHNFEILADLTVPRLERLYIHCLLVDVEAETDTLQSLLSRSSCDLQFLSVTMYRLTPAQSQRFFRVVNSIVHLLLTIMDSESRREIQVLHGAKDVLPRLKHLEIRDGSSIVSADHRPLLDMLWWRRTHTGLESFELSLFEPSTFILPATVMTDFRALAEAGLQLRVVTRDETDINTLWIPPFLIPRHEEDKPKRVSSEVSPMLTPAPNRAAAHDIHPVNDTQPPPSPGMPQPHMPDTPRSRNTPTLHPVSSYKKILI